MVPGDVGELVRDVVAESDVLEGRVVDVDAPRLLALVDPPKIERAIDNLLVNAARHTPQGTRIWIRVLPQDGGVLVCVDDEGPGIPDELKASIFEPFRKGEAGTPGSGIPRVSLRRVPWRTCMGAGPAGRQGRVPRLPPGNARRARRGFTGTGRVSEPVGDRRRPVTHAAFRAFDLMCL